MKITVNASFITTAVAALCNTAYTRPNRPILQAINFTIFDDTSSPSGYSLRMMTTDSAILSTTKMAIQSLDCSEKKQNFSLPAKELLDALKTVSGKSKTDQLIDIDFVDGKGANISNLFGTTLHIGQCYEEYPVRDNIFPYEQIKAEDSMTFSTSVELMEKMVKVAKQSKNEVIELNFAHVLTDKGPRVYMKPIVCRMKSEIMPVDVLVTPVRCY